MLECDLLQCHKESLANWIVLDTGIDYYYLPIISEEVVSMLNSSLLGVHHFVPDLLRHGIGNSGNLPSFYNELKANALLFLVN